MLLFTSVLCCSFAAKVVVVVPDSASGYQMKAAAQVAVDRIYSNAIISRAILPDPIVLDTLVLSGAPQADLDSVVVAAANCSLAVVASSQEIFFASFTDRNVRIISLRFSAISAPGHRLCRFTDFFLDGFSH